MRLLKLALNLMTLASIASLLAVGVACVPSASFAKSGQAPKVENSPVQSLIKARAQRFLTCAPKRVVQGIVAAFESMPIFSVLMLEAADYGLIGEKDGSLLSEQRVYCGSGEWKSIEALTRAQGQCAALQLKNPAAEDQAQARVFIGGALASGMVVVSRVAENLYTMTVNATTQSPNGSWYSLTPDDRGKISNYYLTTYQLQQLLTQNPHSQCMKAKAKVKELEAAAETPSLK